MAKLVQCEICKSIVTPQEARCIQGFYYNNELECEKDKKMNKDVCIRCYRNIFQIKKWNNYRRTSNRLRAFI